MPGKVKVKILAGRNLPVMDRSSDTTDAYVEIKLGSNTHKTDVFRKSLNPQWNSEWFIFEIDDAELQDEPLQIRLMDYDTYSANDAIGKVYLDLNPLLVPPALLGRGNVWAEACTVPPSGGIVLSGWLPVFDTMHGIRGEVSVIVKVELFSDVNKFRQSSCGVQFFSTSSTPCGFKIQTIQGFVKELVVNDDPEYQWIDKIRTPRASNEARQTLFSQLSGEVRRKIGLKVLELGGNAVIGYSQMFDLEGETGLVVRGIGTAVTLIRNSHPDGSVVSTVMKEQHTGRDLGLRLHQSEPDLYFAPYSSMPRLSRFSLTTHEDNGFTALGKPNAGGGSSGVAPAPAKPPCRRKLSLYSLSNLFSKPLFRNKCNRSSRDPSPRGSPSPKPGNLIVPGSVWGLSDSTNKTIIRNRSRSAPFSEMSPIQETHKETISDTESIPVDSGMCPELLNLSPECSTVNIVHSYRDAPLKEKSEETLEESHVICFIGSSDESYSSSDSESSVCFEHTRADSGGGGDNLLAVTQSSSNSVDIDLNATHLPSPCSTRSPHRSVVASSSNEVNARILSTQSPTAVHFHPSAASSSRPSPCPRSSESEISLTPNASSLSDSVGSSGGGIIAARSAHRHGAPVPGSSITYAPPSDTTNLEVLEYPFLTMKTYPPGFIVHLGGTVSARSVKLLDRINSSEEQESRDNWWTELRMEVRSHARALGCSVILGYEEHTSICEEVCVLSAAGTAAIVKLQPSEMDSSMISNKDIDYKRDNAKSDAHHRLSTSHTHAEENKAALCRVCHIPYAKSNIPFPIKLSRCAVCRKGKVPDVLIATIEPPPGMAVTGRGCLIQARLCRAKRDESRGDHQAKEVSDGLPFLEYELHRQLINKLRIKGMNAIFGLKVQVSIGERHMVGLASGTAVYLSALPAPLLPTLGTSNITSKQSKRGRIQKMLTEAHNSSRDHYGVKVQNKIGDCDGAKWTDSEDSEEELNDLDLSAGNKDTCILEIDDTEEVDVLELLIDPQPPEGFEVVTTEAVPGLPENIHRCNLQAFNRVWKGKIPNSQPARHFNRYFEMILRSIYFKLRKTRPCVITNLQFNVDLPEDDEIQITVFGTAVAGVVKPLSDPTSSLRSLIKGSSENEMIFHLEDDSHHNHVNEHIIGAPAVTSTGLHRHGHHGPTAKGPVERSKLYVQKERKLVDITTLIRLPGSRVERYLGHLNFFFIRESTCIREDGGLSGFMQSFITEVLAIVRAHVSALGGNAMVAYFMTQCVLLHNPHKNQGQCLINVGGDVVQAARCPEKDI